MLEVKESPRPLLCHNADVLITRDLPFKSESCAIQFLAVQMKLLKQSTCGMIRDSGSIMLSLPYLCSAQDVLDIHHICSNRTLTGHIST